MGMREILDGNSAVITARFMKDDEEDIPDSITYRIDCLSNNQQVRDDTHLHHPTILLSYPLIRWRSGW
jgi:hypothetical protein